MISLGLIELSLAVALTLISAGLSVLLSLGFHKTLVWSAIRMIVQLMLVGLLLRFIFSQSSAWITLLVFAAMLLAASYETGARLPRRLSGYFQFLVSGTAITISTGFVSAFALLTVLGAENWLEPAHAIPIAGIILGTAMNSASIALNALFANIGSERNAIEAQLALGATRWQALGPLMRRAIQAGLLPVTNQMVGAGIITMPGIMSGQILAGQDPLEAGKYQIFLMLLLASSGVVSTVIAVYAAVRRVTDDRHRLRLDHLLSR
ncbi:putative ABC transport system permease protein [Rhizobium sp. NFR07]|uniref:ABC transporter permease n=1 Tax=Rhizobium sp. NFR07 TaxID=1566262 RepID=UPI0008EAD990|nr:iron export ABC transporter permease subunit FetB [Rhizobium sp. NFR07]SFB54083.1 putative ABC transport system permease protein [Rhizobium sp. NFR07]